MDDLNQVLKSAQKALSAALLMDATEVMLDVRLLMQKTLNVDHAWLMGHGDAQLSQAQIQVFNRLLERRINGEPMAYILGAREFYGLELKTTPATLIPRPDTETLVDAALEKIAPNMALKVLDMGTGTGAIALAVASQGAQAKITAVDFSLEALKIAQENAETLQLANIRFIQSHWFDGLTNHMFDVIVSNPPYIAKDDVHLQQGDLRFEPVSALASGVDGLDDIRVIVANAPKYLNENAWLMLEHGYDQAAAVATLMASAGFKNICHVNDLAGIERVTMGCWSLGS
jgi:release factor glutamine methyltransferase